MISRLIYFCQDFSDGGQTKSPADCRECGITGLSRNLQYIENLYIRAYPEIIRKQFACMTENLTVQSVHVLFGMGSYRR